MKHIFVIAKNTFRAAIRDRILHAMLVFAFVFIGFTVFLGSISLGEDLVVIRSIGLAGIYIFGLMITIFLSASLVYTEIERRTIYLILSKPVSAREMIIGKFLGLWLSVGMMLILMGSIYMGVVGFKGGGFDVGALAALAMEFFELGLLMALVMIFSACSTPFAGTIYGALMVYIGHSLSLLVQYVQYQGWFLRAVAYGVYYAVPNLEKFNVRNATIHHIPISLEEGAVAGLYALLYTGILLVLATRVLKQREL